MKIKIGFIFVLLSMFFIYGCASIVKDMSSVTSGNMALVKGLEMESLKQFFVPIGATKGIVIRQIDDSKDNFDKQEALLSSGRHTLSLLCSYQIGGRYIKSSKGEITIDVKAGNVYQLKADLTNIQSCKVVAEDLGLFKPSAM